MIIFVKILIPNQMSFAKNTHLIYLWRSIMKLGLKFPLLKNKTLELERNSKGREQPWHIVDSRFQFRKQKSFLYRGILVHIHACLHPHHHILGIFWLHGVSVFHKQTRNQVYATDWPIVSLVGNVISQTESNYQTTQGLLGLQKQALIFPRIQIFNFLVVIVQVARSISSYCKLLVFKMIFFL